MYVLFLSLNLQLKKKKTPMKNVNIFNLEQDYISMIFWKLSQRYMTSFFLSL